MFALRTVYHFPAGLRVGICGPWAARRDASPHLGGDSAGGDGTPAAAQQRGPPVCQQMADGPFYGVG